MKVKFVYGILPAFIFKSDDLPENVGGQARAMFVFIKEKYWETDEGLLQHELTHVKQSYRGIFIIHALLYLFSREYKLDAEVAAYAEQLKHYSDDRTLKFAGYISKYYGLDISVEAAAELLMKEAKK